MRLERYVPAVVALMASGCGPTELNSGQSILLAAPLITLVGITIQLLYLYLWRPMKPEIRFPLRRSFKLSGASLALLIASISIRGPAEILEWAMMALVFVGTSYVALLCIVLAVVIRFPEGNQLRNAPLLPWVVLAGPAIYFAMAGSATAEVPDWAALIWILPGYVGLITGPLLVALYAEVLIRRRLHRKRNPKPPAPIFPTARVVRSSEDN